MIKFDVQEKKRFTLIEFELQGPISPDLLNGIDLPRVDFKKGVILSGRGPVWLYCFMVHHYHPSSWIATYDPRIGAVVVATHCPDRKVGEIVEIE